MLYAITELEIEQELVLPCWVEYGLCDLYLIDNDESDPAAYSESYHLVVLHKSSFGAQASVHLVAIFADRKDPEFRDPVVAKLTKFCPRVRNRIETVLLW
jgi:hypothetical protein